MSCNHPFKAFKTGYLTDNGKEDFYIAFDQTCGDVVDVSIVKKPIKIDNCPHKWINGHLFLTDPISIPCGSCIGCRIDKAREWKIRNCLELLDSPECYFLTLTYKDSCLPTDKNGVPVLCKKDFQDFFKRLRKYTSFRYFGCGEYGSLTSRPHGHFLIYGHLEGFQVVGVNQFTCAMVSDCWKFGSHLIENVTPGSIAYVSGYVEKKFKSDLESYPVKPFLMMSRKPGIGMAYFEKRKDKFSKDMHVYGHFSENLKFSQSTVPKAFKRKLSDFPWYEEWKQAAMLAGESIEETAKVVYRCGNVPQLRFLIDDAMTMKLDKVRKESL